MRQSVYLFIHCANHHFRLHVHENLVSFTTQNEDPEYAESDDDVDNRHPETISAKRAAMGKGGNNKRKQGRDKKPTPSQPPSANDDEPSTVIYLGHLPVGFEEREITVFLNQFGSVNRCRVSRSTKTGRSRCYAFVEFAEPEVARIVADTMSGYLLLEKRLVCHVLPRDKVDHELMFAKPKRVPTKKDMQKKARSEVNKVRNADAIRGITARLVKREEMKRKKLGSLGIEYDFPGYAASAAAAAAVQPSATATTGSKKDDVVSSTKKKKKRKLSDDGDEEKENAKSGDEPVKTSLVSLEKKEKKSKKGSLKGKSGGEEEERMEIDLSNDLAEEKKKKKSKKMDVKEKSGREEKEITESDDKHDHADEKKKKSKNVDLTEKCGEEKDKRQGSVAANDHNENAANGGSAMKKASKRKYKTSKK